MIRVITLTAFLWFIANAQDVPHPPKPAGPTDTPSLESTMKFVQDKLNAEGNVTYAATRHDANTNQVLGSTTSSFEVSGAAADPKTCTLSYTKLNLTFAPTKYESRARLHFRGVQKLEVSNVEDRSNQNAAAQGHPELSFTVVPSTYEIVVSMASHGYINVRSRIEGARRHI